MVFSAFVVYASDHEETELRKQRSLGSNLPIIVCRNFSLTAKLGRAGYVNMMSTEGEI
jgi:hypothetical protein